MNPISPPPNKPIRTRRSPKNSQKRMLVNKQLWKVCVMKRWFFLCLVLGVSLGWQPSTADAGDVQFYMGSNAAFLVESPLPASPGVEDTGYPFNWMVGLEIGLNFYRWGFFAGAGFFQTYRTLKDEPELTGTAFSSDLSFQNYLKVDVGVRVLLMPYRSFFQVYIAAGGSFAPQQVNLQVNGQRVERAFAPRWGSFLRLEFLLEGRRSYSYGMFIGAQHFSSSWTLKQPHRFPLEAHQVAFMVGFSGALAFGKVP